MKRISILLAVCLLLSMLINQMAVVSCCPGAFVLPWSYVC